MIHVSVLIPVQSISSSLDGPVKPVPSMSTPYPHQRWTLYCDPYHKDLSFPISEIHVKGLYTIYSFEAISPHNEHWICEIWLKFFTAE